MAKIFVAEDNQDVLSLLTELLGAHEVMTASSLKEALVKVSEAEQRGVTVAFLDGNLGTSDHDGEDVAVALREKIPSIKIISLSVQRKTWGDVNLEKPVPANRILELAVG